MLLTCSSYWYISGKHSACRCAVKLIAGILCIIRQTTTYKYHNGEISHDPQTGYFACSFFKQQKQNVASDCEVTPHTSQWDVLHNHGTPSIFFSFVLKQGHIYKCKIQATHHLTSRSKDLISATPLSWQSHQIGMEWGQLKIRKSTDHDQNLS